VLKVILNIIWVLFAGIELFLLYVAAGFIMMVTLIGIPFGIQAFKLAAFVIWPFGRVAVPIDKRDIASPLLNSVGNVIWLILVGWWLALAHGVFGLILCVTIIGIPLGIQSFKMAGLALWPFGRQIVDAATIQEPGQDIFYLD
jgi:uncharacterized membrane protein YccF (DUF307 family)